MSSIEFLDPTSETDQMLGIEEYLNLFEVVPVTESMETDYSSSTRNETVRNLVGLLECAANHEISVERKTIDYKDADKNRQMAKLVRTAYPEPGELSPCLTQFTAAHYSQGKPFKRVGLKIESKVGKANTRFCRWMIPCDDDRILSIVTKSGGNPCLIAEMNGTEASLRDVQEVLNNVGSYYRDIFLLSIAFETAKPQDTPKSAGLGRLLGWLAMRRNS